MIPRSLFLIGLAFLACSIGSLFILIPLLHAPVRSSGKIPLTQPIVCGGGCGGTLAFLISQSTPGTTGLLIQYEWPKRMDINGSDSISIALTVPRAPLSSESGKTPTPTPLGDVSDRGVNRISSNSLEPEQESNCVNRGITNPGACPISNMFGDGYTVSATAYMITTSFDIQLMGPAERSADQPFVEWDWNIFPKSAGLQIINIGIELRWTPRDKGARPEILRQIWEAPVALEVDKPFIDVGQLSLATVASGAFGTVFTGFSLPWIWEQRRQVIEKKKEKKRRFCRYCGAENPEGFAFCNACGKSRTAPPVAVTAPSSSSGEIKDESSSKTTVQETPAPSTS